jgi:pimeloyl-ACP methyl ester carboxylesterase
LVDRSRTTPIDVYGHGWTVQEIVVATLAKPTTYPQLADLLQQLFATGTAAPELMDEITGNDPSPAIGDPAYLGNREEAYNAIQCADSVVPTDLDSYSRAAVSAQWRSPDFGRISVFDALPCAFWQGRDADRYTGVWNRRTAAPLLVLNTRNDPATPLSGAYEGAAELYDARVVVTEGAGHTSMYVASTCTERVKREYLFSGALPPAGTVCRRDRSPFEETPAS